MFQAKNAILIFCMLLASASISAQINHGGMPLGRNLSASPPIIALASPDLESYEAEDAINDLDKSIPYRFGVNIETDFDSDRMGSWTTLPDGRRVWRLGLSSTDAVSINFQFDVFNIPEGGQVFVYSPDFKQVKGAFLRESASTAGSLGVGFVFGESLVIEYIEPAAYAHEGYLHIDMVTYGYRTVMDRPLEEAKSGPFGNAGQCNINVNCPEGLPYDLEKRSVAVIVVNNNGLCSGSLINTVVQNGVPYFLTANHCLPSNTNNTNTWVFYFNHEAATCGGNQGPQQYSISGASLLASSAESDFALLELNTAPPANYNVCYAGWDASDNANTVTSAVGIHHPRGDVKKICFENNAPFHQNMNTFVNQTWYINQWELGVTEPASSGSPLFNQDGNIIGLLSGGAAACQGTINNGQFDFYGRIGVAWDYGNTNSTRLRNWLDPNNTGILITPNSCLANPQSNDITAATIEGLPLISCDLSALDPQVSIVNMGTEVVTSFDYISTLNGISVNELQWTGNLNPGASTTLNLPQLNPNDGENVLVFDVVNVNGSPDLNENGNTVQSTFYAFGDVTEYTLNIDFDDYPEETTWTVTSPSGIVLYAGGPYPEQTSLSTTFCLGVDFCFDFTILDAEDDGLCCQFGVGGYELIDTFGAVIASGTSFESFQSTLICESLDTQNVKLNSDLFIFPNPAGDEVFIETMQPKRIYESIRIVDLQGRQVRLIDVVNGLETAQRIPFSTAGLPAGLYVVQVAFKNGTASAKLLISR
jgi:V8-like Glu-specific endopeptidase